MLSIPQSGLIDEHKNLAGTVTGSFTGEGFEKLHKKYRRSDGVFGLMQTSKYKQRPLCRNPIAHQTQYAY